jgi:hypothetical protein
MKAEEDQLFAGAADLLEGVVLALGTRLAALANRYPCGGIAIRHVTNRSCAIPLAGPSVQARISAFRFPVSAFALPISAFCFLLSALD